MIFYSRLLFSLFALLKLLFLLMSVRSDMIQHIPKNLLLSHCLSGSTVARTVIFLQARTPAIAFAMWSREGF